MSGVRAALLSLVLLCAGCGSLQTGPVERPDGYPDRTSADAAMATFLWAWHEGDLEVLENVLGMWLKKELQELLEHQDREKVVAYYRNGAQGLRVLDYSWKKEGDEIHYLRAKLATESKPSFELDFALYRFPLGWVVTGQKLVPRGQ